MRGQEVGCFARALGCTNDQITTHDLLAAFPKTEVVQRHDVVLLGGSGDYSAAGEGEWLERILDGLRTLYDNGKPTFASCWGFQAFSRALGGVCVHDPEHAELGAMAMHLSSAGAQDPVFGALPATFLGLSGHEDRVTTLPPGAVLLASSVRVAQQAYTFPDKPIYATQFHPELTKQTFIERIVAYPRYVEQISGLSLEEFEQECQETPAANSLLRRFVRHALG